MLKRVLTAALLVAGIGMGLVVASSLPAQAQTPASCPIDGNYLACVAGATITVTPAAVAPGGQVTAVLSGWAPGSTVTVTIRCSGSPVPLGTVTIGSDSTGQAVFTIPSNCPDGPATVLAAGTDLQGVTLTRDAPLVLGTSIVATSTTIAVGQLPLTGTDSGRMVTLGAALVVIGSAALYGSLRARQAVKG